MSALCIVSACVCAYGTLFAIGCWEANLALHNEPTRDSTPGFIHGYVYTIFACFTNITISILHLCILWVNDPNHEDKEQSSSVSLTCAIAIWGIVLFAGMIDDDIRTGPFQSVVIAQFVITVVSSFLCCCTCIGLACIHKKQEVSQNKENHV
jgi:hypothetical protein